MKMLTNTNSQSLFLGALLSAAACAANAAVINNDYDLTHVNTYAVINSAIFTTPDNKTIVGTGVFDPFVRIQAENGNDSVENGYNTDGRAVQFDTKDANQWSHSLLLSKVSTQVVNGIKYREFFLDINESSGQNGEQYLSLDDFRLFLGSVGDLVDYNLTTNTLTGATKVYDLDNDLNNATTNDPNATIGLDYSNFSGSGNGIDLTVLVPDSVFAGNTSQYVYLYSSFGSKGVVNNQQTCGTKKSAPCPTPSSPVSPGVLPDGKYGASAGFEEWSTRVGVPEPATYWLLGIGLVGLLGLRRLGLR